MDVFPAPNPATIPSLARPPVTAKQENATPVQTAIPGANTSRHSPGNSNTAEDRVTISQEGRTRSESGAGSSQANSYGTQLTAEEVKMLTELKARDREVRAHEQAHLSAAGQYAAGGPSFTYQQGPDGRRYAIGGEVPIDIGKEVTPEATIAKMQIVRRAALAPAEPSSTDRQIAAQASMIAAQARQELMVEQREEVGAQEGEAEDSPAVQDAGPATDNQPAEQQVSSPTTTSGVNAATAISSYNLMQNLGG